MAMYCSGNAIAYMLIWLYEVHAKLFLHSDIILDHKIPYWYQRVAQFHFLFLAVSH